MKRLPLTAAILFVLTATLSSCRTAPEGEIGATENKKDAELNAMVERDDDQVAIIKPVDQPALREELATSTTRRDRGAGRVAADATRPAGSRVASPPLMQDVHETKRQQPVVVAQGIVSSQPVMEMQPPPIPPAPPAPTYGEPANREGYAGLIDNAVMRTTEQPVSTFSIDVDTGSYSNVRRMIAQGMLPPADAVRAEEFINYFNYGYTPPANAETPFSVSTELAPSPWNARRVLMQIGIQGYQVPKSDTPPANLVFLIDTSGSMQSPDKIELLKAAFQQMLPGLRHQDHVSIVVYAGSAGVVLAPTAGDRREEIGAALDALAAGGSTNGAAGIELAYQLAEQNFVDGGINRVILATDGDFNVGTVSIDALKTMIADKRKSGIALTTLGFGQGNYQDETAEQLADVGNGNHAYIDSLQEARKVLVDEMGSTLLTIAKDVKIQVEFNPALVSEYRLIGYENRALRREDFNNDNIDAGEIGAGHDVTAIYELTLVGSGAEASDALRYGKAAPMAVDKSGELAWLKLRYKRPDADTSILIDRPISRSQIRAETSDRLAFAAAVAAYADLLRGGKHVVDFGYGDVLRLARRGLDDDSNGYRQEFLSLVQRTQSLSTPEAVPQISMQH